MKIIMIGAVLAALSTPASAQYRQPGTLNGNNTLGTGSNPSSHNVQGHTTNSGTYVAPHQATNPNNTQMDNYSTRGNQNPYTGQTGTRQPRF